MNWAKVYIETSTCPVHVYTVILVIVTLRLCTGCGGDPHFSILLHDGKKLCYNVQGRGNSVFNLISCSDFYISAKFIADSKREDVTWLGTIGVVMNKALRYGGFKVTHFKFDAEIRTIHIGNKIVLDPKAVREIFTENGSIVIVENNSRMSSKHPNVEFHLKELGLHFIVKFHEEHLDMVWHNTFKGSNTHGLLGEP